MYNWLIRFRVDGKKKKKVYKDKRGSIDIDMDRINRVSDFILSRKFKSDSIRKFNRERDIF